MRMIAKTRFVLTFSITILLALSFIAYAAVKDPYKIELKKHQIFLNSKQLTKSSSEKSYPILSENHMKIAFEATTQDNDIQLGIVDIKTKAEKLIKLSKVSTQIMELKWLGSKKLGVLLHINPNVDLYEIYEVATGKLVNQYYGYNFIWNQAKTELLYMMGAPLDFTVNLNDSTLYQASKNTKLDNNLYPLPSFQKIAFYEYNALEDTKSSIVILTLEKDKVKATVKVPWNKSLVALKWNHDNLLSIGNMAKYDLKKAKLIQK